VTEVYGERKDAIDRVKTAGARTFLEVPPSSFVAVLQILTLPTQDIPLHIALYCLAASLPTGIMAGYSLISALDIRDSLVITNYIYGFISVGLSFIGYASICWHFGCSIGIVFIVSAVISGVVYYLLTRKDTFIIGRPRA
jgi:hypothetical protein